PSLLLKVMSGDTVSMLVQSYYNTNSITTTNSSLNDVLNSLAAGLLNTATGNAEGTLSGFTSSSGPVYSAINSFLPAKDPAPPAGYPKAYLNWIFLDDQFNYVSSSSGSVQAASTTYPAGTLNTVAPGSPINIVKNGYLYIWVSNETQGWDVFFDNLSVQHRQGPILEENHYYPFGLTMAGISDKAIKTNYTENKNRFNKGSELQNREFFDGSGLEMYTTLFRDLDPQLGRWWQIDPKCEAGINPDAATGDETIDEGLESISLYASMSNNPIKHNDPNGDVPDDAGPGPKGGSSSASKIMSGGLKAGAAIIVIGLGPEDVAADAVAGATVLAAAATAGIVWLWNKATGGDKADESNSSHDKKTDASNNQGSGAGRGKNNRKPDSEATGDHSVSNDRGSSTYKKNDKNPTGFKEVKRVDTKGKADNGVPTPHVHENGTVRPAKQEDIPKTDLSKNKPSTQ
ncbi:MAG TPA: hypothetical protein VNV85_15075, partial [Puia sp.]|nr:hypothetical protein [Puia sp.]